MKVYLDDERATPEGWTRVYWPSEAVELLKSGRVTEISLDHDLGNDERGTGYDVVLWIEEQVVLHGFVPPKMSEPRWKRESEPSWPEQTTTSDQVSALTRYTHIFRAISEHLEKQLCPLRHPGGCFAASYEFLFFLFS
jgi:hypothetical protein